MLKENVFVNQDISEFLAKNKAVSMIAATMVIVIMDNVFASRAIVA